MKEQNHPNVIKIRNAHVHNLKHIDVDIPLNKAEHISRTGININAVALWIVFCKYCSHRIESPYHSIIGKKSEAFQSVHHVSFILCYTVLYDFVSLAFSLTRVHKH